MRLIFLLLSIFIFAFARVDDYVAEGEKIKEILNQSVEIYKNGDNLKAKKMAEDAYFQHFENMEGPVGRNVGKKAITMERKFMNLRKHYKDKDDIRKIQALIDGLIFDLDEVVPIIQSGFRLKAEASDLNYDKQAAEKSSLDEYAKREAEAGDIFARIAGNSATSQTKETEVEKSQINSQAKQEEKQENLNPPISQDSVIAQLQAATALNPKLQALFDEISLNLDEAASAIRDKNYDDAKNLINKALFDNYRNSKLEIAVTKNTQKGVDQKFQQSLRKILISIKDQNATEKLARHEFDFAKELLLDAMILIPQEVISDIKVANFDDSQTFTRDFTKVSKDIKIALTNILENYEEKGSLVSIDELQSVYLDIFEASGMESKIGAVDTNLKLDIESKFTQCVALMKSGASKEELNKSFDILSDTIESSLDKISNTSPIFLFLAAFGILLREGLEAIIILVAIVSYLIQSGNKNHLNIAYNALGVGIFLSFVTAFLIYYFFKEFAGQFRELLEGITILVAVLLLIYVGFWLLHKANDKKWSNFIKGKTQEAISKNSARTLWLTVFLAVFREGAETVLFYQALLFDAQTSADFSAIFGGLIVAAILLVIIYFALKAGAVKIPIKLFFIVTSYIIFYMCFVFTGKGISELIEAKLFLPTLLPQNWQFEPITWLGLFPYKETLLPQILVLIILVIGILITKKYQRSHK